MLAAIALAGLAASPWLDARLTRWTHPDLLATRDTPHGRLTLDGRDGQVAVFVDDALAYESQGTTAEEFAALAAVQRETPGAVLVLGGWVEDLAGALAPYGPSRVVGMELDGALPALAAPYLHGRAAPADLLLGDPRRLLPLRERFDLLLSALPEPSTGRANRHYTAEFFARCAASLTDDGVLAIRLRTAENLWTPRQAHRAAAIHAALTTAFADVVVLPGAETVFLASQAPLERDPEVLAARLRRADPPTQLASPAWLTWRYANDRTAQTSRIPAAQPTFPPTATAGRPATRTRSCSTSRASSPASAGARCRTCAAGCGWRWRRWSCRRSSRGGIPRRGAPGSRDTRGSRGWGWRS